MRYVLICLAAVTVLTAAGCKGKNPGQQDFELLMASDMGLGIHLGDSQTTVNEKLGAAFTTRELPGGIMEHYYFNSEMITVDDDTPQLKLTYHDDRLIRIYNRYYPEDADKPQPPYFAELLPGMKLGNRKSDVLGPLGAPSADAIGTEWRLTEEDGRMLLIRASFTELARDEEAPSDMRCSMLYLALTEPVGMGEGEIEENKIDWRDLGKDPEESKGT